MYSSIKNKYFIVTKIPHLNRRLNNHTLMHFSPLLLLHPNRTALRSFLSLLILIKKKNLRNPQRACALRFHMFNTGGRCTLNAHAYAPFQVATAWAFRLFFWKNSRTNQPEAEAV